MKIELSKEFESKLISFIIKEGSTYLRYNITLITGILTDYYEWTNESGINIAGLGLIKTYKIIAAFDNIEEAYAYYQYLIADGGSNGD